MHSQSGFTLVEVLVAMTIMALMMGLLFGGLRMAGRAWNTTEARLSEAAAVQNVQGFLRHTLTGARKVEMPRILDPRRGGQVVFEGGPQAVRLVGALPAHRGGGGLRLIDFLVREGALWMRYRDFLHTADLLNERSPAWDETRLLGDVNSMRVRYYGRLAQAPESSWHDSWREQPYLPQAVEISLERVDTRGRWPDLTVRLPVTERSGARVGREGFGP